MAAMMCRKWHSTYVEYRQIPHTHAHENLEQLNAHHLLLLLVAAEKRYHIIIMPSICCIAFSFILVYFPLLQSFPYPSVLNECKFTLLIFSSWDFRNKVVNTSPSWIGCVNEWQLIVSSYVTAIVAVVVRIVTLVVKCASDTLVYEKWCVSIWVKSRERIVEHRYECKCVEEEWKQRTHGGGRTYTYNTYMYG